MTDQNSSVCTCLVVDHPGPAWQHAPSCPARATTAAQGIAELLREAAQRARETAEKAEPGIWKTWGMQVLADPVGDSDYDTAIPVADGHTPSTSERRLHTGNIDHIALWGPNVALEIARWLENEAAQFDAFRQGVKGATWTYPRDSVRIAKALLRRPQ